MFNNSAVSSPARYLNAPAPKSEVHRHIAVMVSRLARLTLLFAYITLPMWASWLAYQNGYRAVSSSDMLVAMAWMPTGSAIIALSFMQFGWKQLFKGCAAFLALNSIALGTLLWLFL